MEPLAVGCTGSGYSVASSSTIAASVEKNFGRKESVMTGLKSEGFPLPQPSLLQSDGSTQRYLRKTWKREVQAAQDEDQYNANMCARDQNDCVDAGA